MKNRSDIVDEEVTKREREHGEYLQKIRLISPLVEEVLRDHPSFDAADLFHIGLKRFDSLQEKLAAGLRRRILRND